MSGGWIRVGRPSPAALDRLLADAATSDLSYDHVGSTLDPAAFPGRTMYERTVDLGSGDRCFVAAAASLRSWACHRGIGAKVHPADAALVDGTTLLITLPIGPFAVVVPDRIAWTVDEPDRFGFGYGTVEGHQEVGEEAFLAQRASDGSVTATIRVDARTATLAATALSPAVRVFQKAALHRYLTSWRADVAGRLA